MLYKESQTREVRTGEGGPWWESQSKNCQSHYSNPLINSCKKHVSKSNYVPQRGMPQI